MKSAVCSELSKPAPSQLVGLETEYGIRVKPKASNARPSNSDIFDWLLRYVRGKVPVAPSISNWEQGPYAWFTANGGSLRFERLPVLGAVVAKSGVVEGATPECLSARQLLLYQRAQDALLSQAAAASGGPRCKVALVKNNADAHGSVFSSHENYDAEIANGLAFFFWRIGLVAVMVPTALAAECIAAFVLILALILYVPAWLADRKTERFVRWWERGTLILISVLLTPVFLVSNLYFRHLAFRRQRKALLAFLVTRQVFAGAGYVLPNGNLVLSARVQAIGSLISSASEASRPVFLFGHVLKATSFLILGNTSRYRSLFQQRQRLQIAVGDSNMAQTAEYLKIGTTQLVLAAIEAGDLESPPRLRHPLSALRNFSRDLDLTTKAKLANGRCLTMLQIQRDYWAACRRYVDRVCPGRHEPEDLLTRWGQTLDDLEENPELLFGRVDWITKRLLLETGDPLPIAARRKLDAQYHELSREGGYIQLEAAGAAPTIVEPEEVLQAIQQPPPGTRAAARGQLIRENGQMGTHRVSLRIGWSHALKGQGANREVFPLQEPPSN